MPIPRYAARRDRNEPDIAKAIESIGWDVEFLSSGDLPDLLCRHRASGRLALLEIESGDYRRRRSPEQKAMLARWNVPIVKTFDEAAKALGANIT